MRWFWIGLAAVLIPGAAAAQAVPETPRADAPKTEAPAFVDRDGDGIQDGQEHRFRRAGAGGRGHGAGAGAGEGHGPGRRFRGGDGAQGGNGACPGGGK